MNKTITVTLDLEVDAVDTIEAAADANIKSLLEKEINENTDSFIEMMGYDNW